MAQNEEEPKKVTISIGEAGTGVSEDIKRIICQYIGYGLQESGRYTVLESGSQYGSVVHEELKFQQSGLVGDKEKLEVGHALGAEYACYASIYKFGGSNFNIDCVMTDLKTRKRLVTISPIATQNGENDIPVVGNHIGRQLVEKTRGRFQSPDWIVVSSCFLDAKMAKYVDGEISILDNHGDERMPYGDALRFCQEQGGRLPTKEELQRIYANRANIANGALERGVNGGNFSSTRFYWSSSRLNDYQNFTVNFGTGETMQDSKNNRNTFRCVRPY